jgi:glutamate dehydrogenase
MDAGVPTDLAERAASLGPMFSALDITDAANHTGEPLETTAAVYFTLGDRLKLHWLRRHIEALPRDNRWRSLARSALRDDIFNQQASLTAEILRNTPEDEPAEERIEAWSRANKGPLDRTMRVLADINSSGTFDLSTLSVALREVRNLITTQEALSEEAAAT